MHGLIFREFFSFAERATSKGFVVDMIADGRSATAGDFDSPGPYSHTELVGMMDFLSKRTGYELPELCRDFGRYLFRQFTGLHPEIFINQTTALDFPQGIEAHIHEQVRTLVPKSHPPLFTVTRHSENELVMHYQSTRPLADLCAGLIEASIEHFGARAEVSRQLIGSDKTEAVFTITTHD